MQFIDSVDSIRIAAEAQGSGTPLIFAHGLTSHHRLTLQQLQPLAAQHRLIVFDQRGHGASTPVTDPSLYEPRRMARDMLAVLDALGVERAVVGGESMGAATALAFALEHPERVRALLLTAPAFGDAPNADRQRMVDMGLRLAELGNLPAYLAEAAERQRTQFNWTPDLIAFVADMLGAHDPASLATALQAVPLWQPMSDLSALAAFPAPTCIVAWEQDPVHPIELARRMVGTLPDARLETIDPLPAMFRDPPQVGRIYARFLETL